MSLKKRERKLSSPRRSYNTLADSAEVT